MTNGPVPIHEVLADMDTYLKKWRDAVDDGIPSRIRRYAALYISAAEELRKALTIRSYPADPEHDKTEMIGVTAFGVDFLIRHRGGGDNDLFVHIDSTERTVTGVPFVVAVNEAGENEYGDGNEYDDPNAPIDEPAGMSDEAQVASSLHSHEADREAGDDSDEVCLEFPPGLGVHMRRRIAKNGRVEMVVELTTDGLPEDMPLIVIVDGRGETRHYG